MACLVTVAILGVSGSALAKKKELDQVSGCVACHLMDEKSVGPTYQDIAKKYRGDKRAEAKLVAKIKGGGVGVWGKVPMPPNAGNVSDEDIATLVKWILDAPDGVGVAASPSKANNEPKKRVEPGR